MDSRLENHNLGKDEYKTAFFISLTIHGILFLLLTVKILLFPSEQIPYERAIRVDIVDLPDKVISELEKIKKQQKETPKPTPKPVATPKPKAEETAKKVVKPKKNFKSAQSSAFDRLKNVKSASNKKESVAAQQPEFKPIETLEYKGNIVSPGTSLTGLNKLQHDQYLDTVDDHVKKYWNLPEWLASSNLKARVVIFLDKRGFVTSTKLTQSSNNTIFDQKVLESVKKASPFPSPPGKFKDLLAVDGLELRFPD